MIDRLDAMHNEIQMDIERYLEDGYDWTMIAACMVTNALWLYKQWLSPDEYELMVDTISSRRDNIPKIDFGNK